ncbi:MAG TPA: hypothetical protein PLN69_02525 [bacterium]|nr:hypothetical protein [bacterium]
MFGKKLKIENELLERAEKASKAAGYSSVDEFVTHIIEKELAKIEDASTEEEMKNKLQGLGYIS